MNPELELETVKYSIEDIYPQLVLQDPLFCDHSDLPYMHPVEREFATLLLTRGFIVFREPTILDCEHIPDFFIFNRRSQSGKLVEITLLKEDLTNGHIGRKTKKRKERQLEALQECGVPFVVLYREQMENIRANCWEDLF